MSIAAELLMRVKAARGKAEVRGEKLHLAAPRPLPDDLRGALKNHKTEVMAVLRTVAPDDPEVLRRAVLFRAHLSAPGYSKFFVLPGVNPVENTCATCGEVPPSEGFSGRCQICEAAARLALQQLQSPKPRSGRDE